MSRQRKTATAENPIPLTAPAARTYRGRRGSGGAAVRVADDAGERPLELRLDLRRHSPTGFGWGYAGSGPAQLALALAADALGDDDRARRVYQRLKASLVATLPADGWELTADQVRAAVAAIEQGRGVPPTAPTENPPPTRPPAGGHHTLAAPPVEPNAPLRPVGDVPAAHPERTAEPTTTPPGDPAPPVPSHAHAVRPTGRRLPDPFGVRQDAAAGVRLLEDRRFRQVQIQFAEEPPEYVVQAVGEAGFRWLRRERVWAKQIDKESGWQTRAEAEDLFERITALIREAKGITHEHA